MNKTAAEFSGLPELYLDETQQLDPNSSIASSMVHSDNSQTKRKREYSTDVESTLTVPDLCSRATNECGENNPFKDTNLNLIDSKGTRSLDKKELRNLRMQIAMISDADGDRPIHVAVVQENLKLVQKLCAIMLKAAISIDLTNYLRQTPLHLAVMLGNVEMIKLLLKCGSSLLLKDRNGNSVIHLAVKTEAKKDVLCLILSHPLANSILNVMDYEGYTALHYAVLKGNKTAVTCLHRTGADMNVTDGKSGRTALMFAIMERNSDMVKLLLDSGACVDVADYSGRCAFDLALQVSDRHILKMLENNLVIEESTTKSLHQISSDENRDCSGTYHRTKKFKSI